MLDKEELSKLGPFMIEVQQLIDDGDDGTGIASLVGVPKVTPAYLSTMAQVARLYDGRFRIAVNKSLGYYVYIFLLLHEVFHIKLDHFRYPGFTADNLHAEMSVVRNNLLGKILAITEMEANICAGLALFGQDIVIRTGIQVLQEIEDATQNVRQMDSTLSSLRFRWNLTKSPALLEQIKQCETSRQLFLDTLERLQDAMEFQDPPETLDEIAASYGVPVSFLACNLEGYRRMGYTVIPVQRIDWENILLPEALIDYMNVSSY